MTAIYEQVLQKQGMSAKGAALLARSTDDQRLMDERRERDGAISRSLGEALQAPALDLAVVERLLRERDTVADTFERRRTESVITKLRALSPDDRRVFTRLLSSTRSGFIPYRLPLRR